MKFKRVLAGTMALVMVVSGLFVSPVDADANDSSLADGLVAEYLFDGDFADNLDAEQAATPIGTDTTVIATDDVRGNVVNMTGGIVSVTKNGDFYDKVMPSGLQMPASIIADNDYTDGITISFWVKSKAANGFSSLMDISDQNGDYSWGHIELAAGPQLRYNGWGLSGITGDDWFELGAWPADTTVWLGDGGWELFTLTVSPEATTMYIDGVVSDTTTDTTKCARLLAFIDELGKTGRTSFRLGAFQTPGNWDWNWDTYAGSIDDVRVWDRALSATEVAALKDVEADTTVVEPEIIEVEAEDTITTDGTGAAVEYVYNAPEAGTYVVTVTGATDSFGTSMLHPMFGYEMPQYAMNGVLEIRVDADEDNKVFFKLFDEESQELAISIEKFDTTGTMEDPEELELDVVTTTETTGESYWYKWTATEAGTLVITIDKEACAELGWYMDVMINGDWSTTQSNSVNEEGVVEIEVAANDEVTLAVNTFDWVEGTVKFTATCGEGSGDETTGTFDNPMDLIMLPDLNTAVLEDGQIMFFTYTATENGTLMITMKTEESTNGWLLNGYYNEFEYFVEDASSANEDSTLASVELNAGDVVMIKVSTPDETAGTVVFSAFFTEGEGRPEGKEEFIASDVVLNLGENNVTHDPNAETTGFEFAPEEEGTYKFEIAGDFLLGDWGTVFFPQDKTENKTTTLEGTITSVGQSILVGVTGEGDCTITVTKVDSELTKEPEKTEIMYENKVDPMEFELSDDAEIEYVDVTDGKVETAVLGEDGYYHLNTVDGPILFVDLNSNILSLIEAYGYGQVKVTVVNEDGSYTTTNYYDAITEYYGTGMFCVLTEDLITIYKELGNDKGWYDAEKPLGNYLFQNVIDDGNGGVDYENIPCDENAWMFACAYVPATEVTAEDAEYTLESNKDVVITLDTAFDSFLKLLVDGKEVAAENYTVVEGSIVLTLKAAYLETLEAGEHTVEVIYNNANVTLFNLTVAEAAEPEIPAKGDVSGMFGYMVVLMGAALVVIAAKKRFA